MWNWLGTLGVGLVLRLRERLIIGARKNPWIQVLREDVAHHLHVHWLSGRLLVQDLLDLDVTARQSHAPLASNNPSA